MRFATGLLIVVVLLAGCGGDDHDGHSSATPTASGGFNPGAGTDLNLGSPAGSPASSDNQMPGCSDPDSDECPVPLEMELDGEASAGGVTMRYPARYFTATTHEDAAPGSPLIELAPSENNRFQERADFAVYFDESEAAALAELTAPETGPWTGASWSGTIGVSKDEAQTPQVNTAIGAFGLESGNVIVLKAVTTEKYGWDLWSRVYAAMLDTITVTAPER